MSLKQSFGFKTKKPAWMFQTGLKICWFYSIHLHFAWKQIWKWWWC